MTTTSMTTQAFSSQAKSPKNPGPTSLKFLTITHTYVIVYVSFDAIVINVFHKNLIFLLITQLFMNSYHYQQTSKRCIATIV